MSISDQKILEKGGPDVTVVEEIDDAAVDSAQYLIAADGAVQTVRKRSIEETFSISSRALQAWRYLLAVFLPAGYPHSVTEDYLKYVLSSTSPRSFSNNASYHIYSVVTISKPSLTPNHPTTPSIHAPTNPPSYQIYDSLQAFCSSIAGLLSSRAVLSSVGVGDSNASPTAALLLSALQESVGRVATILFAHRLGTSLEPECKGYRLAADVFNDAAMVLDCLSPAVPSAGGLRVAVLSASSALRALCGVAAGSAKASLSAHFARRGNLGELNAKDSSQETVVSLVGMLAGTLVVAAVTEPAATWAALLLLLAAHLGMNYLAVRSVSMTTLNRQRACIVFSLLLDGKPPPEPRHVARFEQVFAMDGTLRYYGIEDGLLRGRRKVGFVEMAVPFGKLAASVTQQGASVSQLLSTFDREQFVVWTCYGGRRTYVVLKDGASPEHVLKSWVLALRVRKGSPSADAPETEISVWKTALEDLNKYWNGYIERLESSGWDLSIASIETGKGRRIRFKKET